MSRIYMSYSNDGKQGLTWAALVAASLIMLDKRSSIEEVTNHIWGKNNAPIDLRIRVTSTLRKMLEEGFVTSFTRGDYAITLKGRHIFERHMDVDKSLHTQSDSVLFTRPYKAKKKRAS